MATDKTQGLPHVAAASAAEIAAAAIAPFVQKRLASLTRSRDACEADCKTCLLCTCYCLNTTPHHPSPSLHPIS